MTLVELIIRIGLATLVGGAVGLERELRDHQAGFRTHILVCIGSATFTLVSAYGFNPLDPPIPGATVTDPSRVAAQIVTGIGFLGAGAIIRQGPTVRGLTTAASLWAVAALGMAVGLGLYALTAVALAAVLVSLAGLRLVERRIIEPRLPNIVHVAVEFEGKNLGGLSRLVETLDANHVVLDQLSLDDGEGERGVRMRVRLPKTMHRKELRRLIEELGIAEDVDVS